MGYVDTKLKAGVKDPSKLGKTAGGQIANNKAALGALPTLNPGLIAAGAATDKDGAGSKTFGAQWDDNRNTIKDAGLGYATGGPGGAATGALLGATADPHGAVQKGISHFGDQLTDLAPKIGLGTYKSDGSGYSNDNANNMQADAKAGAANAAARPTVVTPLTWNQTPQTVINTAPQDQIRTGQNALISQLQDSANGIGPSLAQDQLQRGKDANIAAAMALGASQRGLTPGQSLRQIADQTTSANQQAANAAATLRLTEQLGARDQLSGVLSGARGQDINLATSQATLDQANNLANSQGQLGAQTTSGAQALTQQAQNDALVKAYLDQGVTLEVAKMKAAQDLETMKSNNFNADQTRRANMLGAAGGGLATILAA